MIHSINLNNPILIINKILFNNNNLYNSQHKRNHLLIIGKNYIKSHNRNKLKLIQLFKHQGGLAQQREKAKLFLIAIKDILIMMIHL